MVSQTYLGNPNLKAKSVPVSFTKEEVQELITKNLVKMS